MSAPIEIIKTPIQSESITRAPREGVLQPADGTRRWVLPDPKNAPANEPDLIPALRVLRKHWRSTLAFALVVVAAVTAFVFIERPVYEPAAQIQLDAGNEVFSIGVADSRSDPAQYAETQAKNLQGRELAVTVIRKLHLDQNADWLGSTPKSGEAITQASAVNGNGAELTPAEYQALDKFTKSLKVERDGSSWLIKVSFAANDPQLAALVTNTVIETFIEREYKTRNDVIAQSTEWLSRQLDDIRQRMNQSNQALANFQKTSGITAAGNSINSFDERMSDLNRQLTAAQADRIQLEALLNKAYGNTPSTLAQVSADPTVQELSKKLDTARADLKTALVIYGKNHPKAQELQAQVDELQVQLSAQQNRVVSNLRTNYAAAHARENLLNGEIKSASSQLGMVAQYENLKKTAEANEALYNSLYAKVKEAAITAEAKTSNIRWVEHAPVLDKPTRPKRMLDIAAAMLAGLIGGIVLAFVRESIDNRLHTIEDVRYSTGLPSVSLVPLMANTNGRSSKSQIVASASKPFLLQRPNSPEAEALRGLFTSVTLSMPGRTPQVLLIASSAPSEGKTTIAANLAIALARTKRTCVVDADLRKPSLARVFGIKHERGLAELLCDVITLEEALVPVPAVPNLTVLPVGTVIGTAGELLTAEKMARILQDLRQQFDAVVVDSPPIIPYADARAISPLADGVILVGRSGVTTRDALKRSLELLREVHSAPVLDVVLNAVPHTSPDYGYHYGYATR